MFDCHDGVRFFGGAVDNHYNRFGMKKNEFSIINTKLDKIIQQNTYIIEMLETMHDDALGLADLQRRHKEAINAIRQMEYKQWFEQHKRENKL